jgi:hypothetical protein
VPVRQWVLSFPIPLRYLFAAHPDLLAPVLQIVHRVISAPGAVLHSLQPEERSGNINAAVGYRAAHAGRPH